MTSETRRVAAGAGFAFPILLIAAGVYAYLVNNGAVAAPRWDAVVALWPLLLVVAGIDLLVARRSPALAVAAIAATVVLALVVVSVVPTLTAPASTRASVPLAGVQRSSVDLSYGAGRLSLGGGATSLVEVDSTGGDVETHVDQAGSSARVRITQPAASFPFLDGRPRSWDVHLNPAVLTDLTLSLGAGDFDVDLGGLRIASATLTVGASDLRLVLPHPQGEARISLQGGASSIRIEIPAGVEARIDTPESGLTSVSGPTQTAGYAAATDRVSVVVRAGVSSVRIAPRRAVGASFGASDSGRSAALAVGDELRVVLDANPSTGFDWEVVAPASPALALLSRTFTSGGNAIGAPGTVEYRFRAAAAGTTTLALAYRRSWEAVPPQRTFSLDVTVR